MTGPQAKAEDTERSHHKKDRTMSEREELEADTLNMSQGEQSEWMGTDPYRWAHACIQHAKAAGPASGEDEDDAALDFVATWFANAMMAKSDAVSSGYTKGNGELVGAVREMVANDGEVGSQQYDALLFINARARVVKALSDSEGVGQTNGDHHDEG